MSTKTTSYYFVVKIYRFFSIRHRAISRSAGEVQAFQQDLSGKQYINRVYNLGVDKMYEILFSESDFIIDFRTQRGFSGTVMFKHMSIYVYIHILLFYLFPKVSFIDLFLD